MQISISNVILLLLLLLNGCGGGGGGSSSSSTTTTPTVFASGNSMAYLRHLAFDGNYLYVVDSNTVATSTSPISYAHLRQFSATSSGSAATTFENSSTNLKNIFSVVKFNSDLLMTATVVGGSSGVIKVSLSGSTYLFTDKVVLSNSLYGLAVDSTNNRLFVADQSGPSILIYDQYYVACGSTNTNCTLSSPISGPWTRPTGLAYNGNYGGTGYIYVTDYSGGTAGLYKINASTLAVTSISSSLFKNPNGVAINTSTGDVYVVNTGTGDTDSTILKITSAGVVSTFLDGSVTSNMLCKPIGAAISGSYLYVTNGICTTNITYASSVIKINL